MFRLLFFWRIHGAEFSCSPEKWQTAAVDFKLYLQPHSGPAESFSTCWMMNWTSALTSCCNFPTVKLWAVPHLITSRFMTRLQILILRDKSSTSSKHRVNVYFQQQAGRKEENWRLWTKRHLWPKNLVIVRGNFRLWGVFRFRRGAEQCDPEKTGNF